MQAFAVETRFHSQPAHTYTRMSDIYMHIPCVVIPLSSAADYVSDSSVIVPDNNIRYLSLSQSPRVPEDLPIYFSLRAKLCLRRPPAAGRRSETLSWVVQ